VAIVEALDPMPAAERAAWCAARDKLTAARELVAGGIPACAVIAGYAALDDAQLQARAYFEPITHEVVGEQQFPRFPLRFSHGPQRFWRRPAPMLGEHNREVLGGELGLDDSELARLVADNVIGRLPVT
jgi:crotonobetainyl-CoA:carnitine CoA-transferase CaiB-like acyl-CoA transferase